MSSVAPIKFSSLNFHEATSVWSGCTQPSDDGGRLPTMLSDIWHHSPLGRVNLLTKLRRCKKFASLSELSPPPVALGRFPGGFTDGGGRVDGVPPVCSDPIEPKLQLLEATKPKRR